MKRWLKYIAYFFGSIIALILLLLLIIQTGWFKDWLRDTIVEEANATLNGTMKIGKIDGNFLSNLQVSSLSINDGSGEAIRLGDLQLEYSPGDLFGGEVTVDRFHLDDLAVHLRQLPDSSWNLEHLAPADTTPVDTSTQPLGWIVNLVDFALNDAEINLHTLQDDALIPRRLDNLDIALSATYGDDQQALHLKQFNFDLHEPDFQLQELSLRFNSADNVATLDSFVIRTAQNGVLARGEITQQEGMDGTLSLNVQPLAFQGVPVRSRGSENIWKTEDLPE